MTTEKTHWFDRENDPILKKVDLVDSCAPEAAAIIKEVDDQIDHVESLLHIIESEVDSMAADVGSQAEPDNVSRQKNLHKLANDLTSARNLLSEAPTLEALEALESKEVD